MTLRRREAKETLRFVLNSRNSFENLPGILMTSQ